MVSRSSRKLRTNVKHPWKTIIRGLSNCEVIKTKAFRHDNYFWGAVEAIRVLIANALDARLTIWRINSGLQLREISFWAGFLNCFGENLFLVQISGTKVCSSTHVQANIFVAKYFRKKIFEFYWIGWGSMNDSSAIDFCSETWTACRRGSCVCHIFLWDEISPWRGIYILPQRIARVRGGARRANILFRGRTTALLPPRNWKFSSRRFGSIVGMEMENWIRSNDFWRGTLAFGWRAWNRAERIFNLACQEFISIK